MLNLSEHVPWGLIFCCCFMIVLYSTVKNVPGVLMHFILKGLTKNTGKNDDVKKPNWNVILHMDKRTHKHRNIVIPCPDFLYSTVALDFSSTNAIIFTAPASTYGSLGIYDSNAKCMTIFSHAEKSLRVIIVGPSVKESCTDDDIRRGLNEPNDVCIYRLATMTGLLLHRLLMPTKAQYEEIRGLQTEQITATAETLPHSCTTQTHNPVMQLYDYIRYILYVPVTVPALVVMLSVCGALKQRGQLCSVMLGGVANVAMLCVCMVFILYLFVVSTSIKVWWEEV